MSYPFLIKLQDFQFKKINTVKIFEPFNLSEYSNSLIVSDDNRGLLYLAHNDKLTVYKPKDKDTPESRFDIDLQDVSTYIALNCNNTFLAVAYNKPTISIYDAAALSEKNLNLLTEIRILCFDPVDNVYLSDLKWNTVEPDMLCTIATDYTIGCFQMQSPTAVNVTGFGKLPNLQALCVSWSPKGEQIAIGCKNGSIVQLKPDLKVTRTIKSPSSPTGEIIAISWFRNYQLCAAYFETSTQYLTITIIDAPEGKSTAKYTNTICDELTNRIPEGKKIPSFFFSHIAEWGLIVAVSNICIVSSVNDCVETPIIKPTNTYPVGLAVDKPFFNKICLGKDVINNHFQVLHILENSGNLLTFYIVNLRPDCASVYSPTKILNMALEEPINLAEVDIDFNTSIKNYYETVYIDADEEDIAPSGNVLNSLDDVTCLETITDKEKQVVQSQHFQLTKVESLQNVEETYEISNKITEGFKIMKELMSESFAWIKNAKSKNNESVNALSLIKLENIIQQQKTNLDNISKQYKLSAKRNMSPLNNNSILNQNHGTENNNRPELLINPVVKKRGRPTKIIARTLLYRNALHSASSVSVENNNSVAKKRGRPQKVNSNKLKANAQVVNNPIAWIKDAKSKLSSIVKMELLDPIKLEEIQEHKINVNNKPVKKRGRPRKVLRKSESNATLSISSSAVEEEIHHRIKKEEDDSDSLTNSTLLIGCAPFSDVDLKFPISWIKDPKSTMSSFVKIESLNLIKQENIYDEQKLLVRKRGRPRKNKISTSHVRSIKKVSRKRTSRK